MKDEMPLWIILFIGLVMGFLVGHWVGVVTEGNKRKAQAIDHGAAHFDTKTGNFTWNNEVKP